jgi:HEPN domain-containing protein
MKNEEQVRKLMDLASKDLRLAESARETNPDCVEGICFYCQQSAEKYMKAFLAANGIEYPYTHNLVELSKLCEPIEPTIADLYDKFDVLSVYAVATRYDGSPDITEGQSITAISDAKRIKDFLRRKSRNTWMMTKAGICSAPRLAMLLLLDNRRQWPLNGLGGNDCAHTSS